MANTTTTKRVRKTAPKTETKIETATEPVAETVVEEQAPVTTQVQEEKKQYTVKKNLDPSMYVTVKNGFNGTLVYKSRKTGEQFIWQSFGDEQDMELAELKAAKNSYKSFFINNWFLFDDPEIVEWLGMGQYYKHALNSESFDKLFSKSPEEIEATISELSDGQKKSVIYRAKQLIASGEIDSLKVINALEKSLSVELIEH